MVSVGGQFGPILAYFGPLHHTPTRARAYNDSVKGTVLLKTRSSGGILDPLIERVLTLQIGTHT